MENIIHWAIELPQYVTVPIYLALGAIVGINYRFFFARHLWKKHQSETRPDHTSCWCRDSTTHPFISAGDWVAIGIWTAPVLWPIHLPLALFIMSVLTYGKVLRLIHSFAQGGAKRMFAQYRTDKELRQELERANDRIQTTERTKEDYKKALDAAQKEFDLIRSENQRLKDEMTKAADANTRFEQLLAKSQTLLDRQDEHLPGEIPCSECQQFFMPTLGGGLQCPACKEA